MLLFDSSLVVAARVVVASLVVLVSGPFAFTTADLQGLERGLVAEAEAVKAAESAALRARLASVVEAWNGYVRLVAVNG